MTRTQWKCPRGKHPGVLGPGRPRKDDARRYCLTCTAETGRLTERISPAVERQRAKGAESARARSVAKAARERAKEDRYYDVEGTHALKFARELARLPAFSKVSSRQLSIVMHRVSSKHRKWGHALGHTIDLFVNPTWTYAELRDTLLHELAHVQLRGKRLARHHGKQFQTLLERAHRQANEQLGALGERRVMMYDSAAVQAIKMGSAT